MENVCINIDTYASLVYNIIYDMITARPGACPTNFQRPGKGGTMAAACAMILKTKLKEYRKRLHINQFQLARLVGVRRETIGSLERGKYNPSLRLAVMIAKVLQTTVEELFFYEPDAD